MARYLDDTEGLPTLWARIGAKFAEKTEVPSPSNNQPKMDGNGASGDSKDYARANHVHPTDITRAPKSHSANSTAYGGGNDGDYGHVRLSDAIDSDSGSAYSIAATPKAVKAALEAAKQYADEQDADTTYAEATTETAGLLSAEDKVKLDGITAGAQPNQNAFTSISAGGATVAADATDDTVTIVAGDNVSITANVDTDTITISSSDTTYGEASATDSGLMTSTQFTKLRDIAANAEVNQNAFSNVKIGETTVAADSKTDTLTLVAGNNVTLTPDADSDSITIAATDTTYTAMESSEAKAGSATTPHLITAKVLDDAIENKGYSKTTGTVTKVSTGVGLTGGDITGTGTVKAKLKSETALTADAAAVSETAGKIYPVVPDKSGNLAVSVPWTDNNTTALSSMTGTLGVDHGGTGATTLTGLVKGNGTSAFTAASASDVVSTLGTTAVNRATADANGDAIASTYMKANLKGAKGGVAELDSNGTVPASQLPSYVDDVLEYNGQSNFPTTGETGKIYVDTSSNKTYRWSGSAYVEISASLALGTTSSTAFRGDYGNTAYTHAVTNKGSAFASGLYKITTNAEGHVTAATKVEKSDITALGIPGSDTNTWNALVGATSSANGTAGYVSAPPSDGYNTKFLRADGTWVVPPNSNTWNAMTGATSSANGTAGYVPAPPSDGYNTKFLSADGTWKVPANTTYSAGTGLSLSGTTINHASSVTAGTVGTSSATSGSTIAVPYVTYNASGHITGTGTHTHTVSGFATSDTKNTAGSTDSSSKLFIIGATSQADNPQTYSQDTAYVGTDGHLYSNGVQTVNLSSTQALTNKTYNGYTLAAACAKAVTDSSSASAIGTGTSLPTERDIYYGLPTINNSHAYTSSTNIYAPTTGGTSGYLLQANGTTSTPTWVAAPTAITTAKIDEICV